MNVHLHHLRLKQCGNREHEPPCFEWHVPFTRLLHPWPRLEEVTPSPRDAEHGCSKTISDFYFLLRIFPHFANFIQPAYITLIIRKEKYVFNQHQHVKKVAAPRQPKTELHLQRPELLNHGIGSFRAGWIFPWGGGGEAVLCTVGCLTPQETSSNPSPSCDKETKHYKMFPRGSMSLQAENH